MSICYVCAIDLVLAAHVLKPFRNAVVVRADPASDSFECAELMKFDCLVPFDTHESILSATCRYAHAFLPASASAS